MIHAHQVDEGQHGDQTPDTVTPSFDDMPLHQHLLRGIYSHGFESPSPIQQRAIVPMIRGGDLIAQAQSGTGKTGAFTIGMLQRCEFRLRQLQGIVLSPTRELAQQTYEVLSSIGDYLADGQPFCGTFVGGTPLVDDIKKLKAGMIIAVGTPGRIADVIRRGALRTEMLKVAVLDEADEMLSQGFADQVHGIFRFLPRDIQIALFSATMPPEVLELTEKFMRNPTRILVNRESLTLEGIKQYYIGLSEDDKLMVLMDLYDKISIAQSVVFAGTKRKVEYLKDQLTRKHFTVAHLHADMPRSVRERVMQQFRSGSSRVLVTTDLVARGIDVHHVNMVINFDLPANKENYLHRIGRSGRFGRKGVAINFVTESDVELLRELEAYYHTQIDEMPMDFADHLNAE